MTTLLISGIASHWGSLLAERLSARPDLRLIGIDSRLPQLPVGRADLISLPLRGEQLAELLSREQVQTVVQVGIAGELVPMEREQAKQANVIGALELLGACLHSHVQHVIVRSSTLVYGPDSTHPAFVRESRPPAARHATPWLRDLAEVEQVVAQFAARHVRPTITVLRLAQTVGALRSGLGMRLRRPLAPRPLGFDPRVQLLHSDDALAAFEHAIAHPLGGAINIAADPPLPLSRALRMASAGLSPFDMLKSAFADQEALPPLDAEFLRYDCVADTTLMREEFGFVPEHDAEASLALLAPAPTLSAPSREVSL